MTNRHTLKFSIFAAAILALALPAAAAAQWGGAIPRIVTRSIRQRTLRRSRTKGFSTSSRSSAKDFERDIDRALDHSRTNGSNREDEINNQVHQFRDAVGDLKSRVGNGRDLNRSSNEARRVLQEADNLDRFGGAEDSIAAPLQSGRRSNRSCATSATSMVLAMVVMAGRRLAP